MEYYISDITWTIIYFNLYWMKKKYFMSIKNKMYKLCNMIENNFFI